MKGPRGRDLRTTHYFHVLSDRERIRVQFTTQRGEPVELGIQLECEIDGEWVQCRRYDTAGGELHVHPLPWHTDRDSHVPVHVPDLKTGLNLALDDLERNWQRYRRACERDRKGGEHETRRSSREEP